MRWITGGHMHLGDAMGGFIGDELARVGQDACPTDGSAEVFGLGAPKDAESRGLRDRLAAATHGQLLVDVVGVSLDRAW